jgi:hypothetical protein
MKYTYKRSYEYEININEVDYIATYHVNNDTLFVRKCNGIEGTATCKLPQVLSETGLEDWLYDNGYLNAHGMTEDRELEAWVEETYTLDISEFAQNINEMTEAVILYLNEKHHDKF